MKHPFLILGFLSLLVGCANSGEPQHVLVRPDALNWGAAPPGLPAGAQVAVLTGDPSKPGPFVMRAKMPDGYTVRPHWHSIDENITVLKGTLLMGHGDTIDPAMTDDMPEGSYVSMPGMMHHFAIAKGYTIIQIHGNGPFDITYINPSDDPRKQAEK